MTIKKIKLGYQLGTANEVFIAPAHLIVTGITQLSGKTTTLEALIKRSGLRAVVFKTKIGEKSFTEGTEIPPFFKDRSDYEFVRSLIEAYSKEKLFLEKGTLMKLCKGSASLLEIKKKVDEALLGKLRGIEIEIYTRLQHYLENLIPQIQYANLSQTLSIYEGINIMNLERFTEEVQALIIQSVSDEVLKSMKNVIIVIPEAWKFLPQKYNSPCKRVVESFIRQGATNENYIWIDSQDMAGVDKIPLKQISTWILGYQAERNEVKHTLDEISLPRKSKPKEEEIMNLKKGQFILSSYEGVERVYIQPAWLDDETSIKISRGELDVNDVEKPSNLVPFSHILKTQSQEQDKVEIRFDDSKIRKDLIELRQDFFNKIQELQNFEQKLAEQVYSIKSQTHEVNEDEIISKVLQKISINNMPNTNGEILELKKDIARINGALGGLKKGAVTYEISPLEKIKKDFLQRAKDKVLSDIQGLSDDSKLMLKYLEAKGQGCKSTELEEKCYHMKHGGSASSKVSKSSIELRGIGVGKKDTAGFHRGILKDRITDYLINHEAKPEEIESLYQHILMEIIK